MTLVIIMAAPQSRYAPEKEQSHRNQQRVDWTFHGVRSRQRPKLSDGPRPRLWGQTNGDKRMKPVAPDSSVPIRLSKFAVMVGRVQPRMERTFGAISHSDQATPPLRLSPFRSFGG